MACHPKFSAQQRLIVFARLVGGPNAATLGVRMISRVCRRLPGPPAVKVLLFTLEVLITLALLGLF